MPVSNRLLVCESPISHLVLVQTLTSRIARNSPPRSPSVLRLRDLVLSRAFDSPCPLCSPGLTNSVTSAPLSGSVIPPPQPLERGGEGRNPLPGMCSCAKFRFIAPGKNDRLG
jgi:hypothetical protein